MNAATLNQKTRSFLLIVTAICVSALELIDMTIVSVSVDNMRGSLSASVDQISWVITTYIIASTTMLPMVGFFSRRFGRRRLMLIAIVGFGVSSMLCGAAQNLTEMVILRFIQGAFGALMVPLSRTLLADSFPKEEFGRAMSYFGIGFMVAPMMGPVLGGVIAQYLNWRWDFYVNIPICFIAFFLVWHLVEDVAPEKKLQLDWVGMLLLLLTVGPLEYILNEGNRVNWFASNLMIVALFISVFSGIYFLVRAFHFGEKNIFNLYVFKDWNFAISCVVIFLVAFVMAAINAWEPTILQSVENYPVLDSGLSMMPRGISALIGFLVMPTLMKYIDRKYLLVSSLLLFGLGSFHLTEFTYMIGPSFFTVSNIIQGFAIALFFPSLSVFTYMNIGQKGRDMASGLFTFAKTLGNSVGVAAFANLISHEQQVSWHTLAGSYNVFNANFLQWVKLHHLKLGADKLGAMIAHSMTQQSSVVAYDDGFMMVVAICLAVIPFCILLKRATRT